MKILQFGILAMGALFIGQTHAVGTWSAVKNQAQFGSGGLMLLLSDGTVMSKTSSGGSGNGNIWLRLTPDSKGSYANGTWTNNIAPMHNTRLYFTSQVLTDGRVYVAGGEYGDGINLGETYDPLKNTWTLAPSLGVKISDATSAILPDGKVMQAYVGSGVKTYIYDPIANTYAVGPTALGRYGEAVWMKLADNSILYVHTGGTASSRFIPAQNKWVADGTVPVKLYDPFGFETGGALLLPDGRAFFLGSQGASAIYTPSGGATPGTWKAGASLPNNQGSPDAPSAMMVNGKIICAVSPVPTAAQHFPSPTSFYEYDYLTDAYTRIDAPAGGSTLSGASYQSVMLTLPDGTVMFVRQGSKQYYVYTPDGTPLASGKPTISKITHTGENCLTGYTMTGTLFNGISEGASYGDDAQMNSNYPLVRLTSGTNVFYARTFNWNTTGVQRGALTDTTEFTLPAGLPQGPMSLEVVANGIASNPTPFTSCVPVGVKGKDGLQARLQRFTASSFGSMLRLHFQLEPTDAAEGTTTLQLAKADGGMIYREILSASGAFDREIDLSRQGKGVFLFVLKNAKSQIVKEIAVQ